MQGSGLGLGHPWCIHNGYLYASTRCVIRFRFSLVSSRQGQTSHAFHLGWLLPRGCRPVTFNYGSGQSTSDPNSVGAYHRVARSVPCDLVRRPLHHFPSLRSHSQAQEIEQDQGISDRAAPLRVKCVPWQLETTTTRLVRHCLGTNEVAAATPPSGKCHHPAGAALEMHT